MRIETIRFEDAREDGIIVSVFSGVHGNELATMIIADKLIDMCKEYVNRHIEKSKFNNIKCINIIPCVNKTGLQKLKREFISPEQDASDMNRCWVEIGEENERIRNTLKHYISISNVVIDLHCSNNITPSFLIDSDTPDIIKYLDWCETNDIPCVVRDTSGDTIKGYTYSKGKVGLTWEQNGLDGCDMTSGELNEITERMFDIINKTFYLHKSIKGSKIDSNINIDDYRMTQITSPCDGIYVPIEPVRHTAINVSDEDKIIGYIIQNNGDRKDIILPAGHRLVLQTRLSYVKEYYIIAYMTGDIREKSVDNGKNK